MPATPKRVILTPERQGYLNQLRRGGPMAMKKASPADQQAAIHAREAGWAELVWCREGVQMGREALLELCGSIASARALGWSIHPEELTQITKRGREVLRAAEK